MADLSLRNEQLLKSLPSMPIDQYEAGWTRKVGSEFKTYPQFKQYLWTAESRKHYDIYADITVRGKQKTFWLFFGTLADFAKKSQSIIEEQLDRIAVAMEESDPDYDPEEEPLSVDYLWRVNKAEEDLKTISA